MGGAGEWGGRRAIPGPHTTSVPGSVSPSHDVLVVVVEAAWGATPAGCTTPTPTGQHPAAGVERSVGSLRGATLLCTMPPSHQITTCTSMQA